MAGNRAMQFTCRDRTWYETPLWAPGVTPEVIWETPWRAPLSQHRASFKCPNTAPACLRHRWGGRWMAHIWKRHRWGGAGWLTSESERQIKNLDISLLPLGMKVWTNGLTSQMVSCAHGGMSLPKDNWKHRKCTRGGSGLACVLSENPVPATSSDDPSLLPEDQNSGHHSLNGRRCRHTPAHISGLYKHP